MGDDGDEIRALEDMSEFEAEEAALLRRIESKKRDSQELERLIAARKEAVAEVEVRKREAEERRKGLEGEVGAVRRRLEEVKEQVKEHETQVHAIKTLIAKYQGTAEEVQGAVDEEEAALDHMLTQLATTAHGHNDAQDTERTEEEIDAELALLDKKLRAAERERDADDVTAEYHKALQAESRKGKLLSQLKEVRDLVARLIKKLNKQQKKVRKVAQYDVNHYFKRYLQCKAFKGSVHFEKGKMDLVVHTQVGEEEEVSTPVSRLSGGEKSFSTLCLILALKQANDSPLLALDEIDVFMDERSRRIALEVSGFSLVC